MRRRGGDISRIELPVVLDLALDPLRSAVGGVLGIFFGDTLGELTISTSIESPLPSAAADAAPIADEEDEEDEEGAWPCVPGTGLTSLFLSTHEAKELSVIA